jgi:hypothetical protein
MEVEQLETEGDMTPEEADGVIFYKEMTRSAKWHELIAERVLREAKERDQKMRLDLEKWNEDRRLEMKGLREEQLRWLWESKQKEERGGWFGFWRKKMKEMKDIQ